MAKYVDMLRFSVAGKTTNFIVAFCGMSKRLLTFCHFDFLVDFERTHPPPFPLQKALVLCTFIAIHCLISKLKIC